jgi:hypothetical protein
VEFYFSEEQIFVCSAAPLLNSGHIFIKVIHIPMIEWQIAIFSMFLSIKIKEKH